MSIVGPGDASIFPLLALAATALALLASVGLFVYLKVYRPSRVVGPDRVDPLRAPIVIGATGIGVTLWIGVQAWYASHHGIVNGKYDAANLTAKDWLFLSTAPAILGFLSMWVVDFVLGGGALFNELGFTLGRFGRGIRQGIIAAIVIIPPTYVLADAAQWLYERIHFKHPDEHELLKQMQIAPSSSHRAILVASAVILAPFFEEFLFRGHLQTLLRRTLVSMSRSRIVAGQAMGAGFPVLEVGANPLLSAPSVEPVATPLLAATTLPVWQAWLSIGLASTLFAMVHEPWMWPPIFFLSLGLGYCYERTGNLWTNITVHVLFNTLSTVLFLNFANP